MIADQEIRYGCPLDLTEALALWLRQGVRVAEFQTIYVGRNEGGSKRRFIDPSRNRSGVAKSWLPPRFDPASSRLESRLQTESLPHKLRGSISGENPAAGCRPAPFAPIMNRRAE
jgi:hypothetical protein